MPHIKLPPGAPGILGPLTAYPDTERPLNDLVNALLCGPSSLSLAERELIATYVSHGNECRFCASSHAAAARHLFGEQASVVDQVLAGVAAAPIDEKMQSLLAIADHVRRDGRLVTESHVARARAAGADDRAIHDTVLIAAAFCMFNRYVDGLATWAPSDSRVYNEIGADRSEWVRQHVRGDQGSKMMRNSFFVLLILVGSSAMSDDAPSLRCPSLPKLKPEQYLDDARARTTADEIERLFPGQQPESVRMLLLILRGEPTAGPNSWFGPAQSRYSWAWLAKQQGVDPAAGAIARQQFRGAEELWQRLDRDGDGRITPDDLDWSDRSPWVQQSAIITRIFRRLDSSGNGRLERDDFERFLERASPRSGSLTLDEFRQAFVPPTAGFAPGDAPTRAMLVEGLYSGELGAIREGPNVGEAAPDFTLKTSEGETEVQLSKLIGEKPVVLVLGNLTCGPYRAMFPEVENVHARHRDQARFLMVYVREAHPEDGWRMELNRRVNVEVKQPTTLAQRAAVCNQFCQRLKPTMPVVVDDVSDAVGQGYSGMPSRLYVIDPAGKIAFKSGRGPFGFRVGEMEQALVMAILEQSSKNKQ